MVDGAIHPGYSGQCEANHSPSSVAMVKNAWTSTPTCLGYWGNHKISTNCQKSVPRSKKLQVSGCHLYSQISPENFLWSHSSVLRLLKHAVSTTEVIQHTVCNDKTISYSKDLDEGGHSQFQGTNPVFTW
jgi:hypothetical protein